MKKEYPSKKWPSTKISEKDDAWACRINEWCALISVNSAKEIEKEHNILFGNCDNGGDTGAYWFSVAIENGYSFSDPLFNVDEREKYYIHGYKGKSGHSVWVNQGNGKNEYPKNEIKKRLYLDFSFEWNKIENELKG